MKKLFALLLLFSTCSLVSHAQILKKLGDKIKDKTNQRVDQKTDQTIDKGLDKTEDATKKKNTTGNNDNSNNNNKDASTSTMDVSSPATLKVYANYDFVPGDKIMFEDNFTDDQDGEFPSHWNLDKGQAILNKLNSTESFYLTDGNYCVVTPLTKTKSYLTDPFTIEYDIYNPENGAYGLMCFFKNSEGNDVGYVQTSAAEATCQFADDKSLSGSYPAGLANENFKDKWHHVAIAFKNKQIKIYVDQFRVLVVPNSGISPEYVEFGGIGDNTHPIIFKNVRIASGGDMNMLGKKFTETKIVTHGINFDIDKATIKPESLGTLNMIVKVMTDNPDIKFEVDGHTDNTGTAAHNLTLSQQRADAVKDQLIKMGIDTSRVSSKGFGDTKPISDNNTLEGRANNRRVEFVKQ